ncbi:pancreatic secretory granule membrane major glycoprotein GP2-like [Bufo bufo]|uniref:pancreatic secretory granule membrane major glycoprotein GP2-like n=1 Tax=Bufo bufo TaxID=8384 RepID=UPI001ABEB8D8|nr:pancreatic secretory granule membrane major glycoprotein GP2-like [Bufo bufo]
MIFPYILVFAAVFIQKGGANPQMCSTCGGGSCTADNGCSCNNDLTISCVPTNECASVGTNICCPTGYYWSSVDNCCTDTLLCNPSCMSEEICQNVSAVATCSCNTTLFYGMSSSSFVPTVTCESAVITISMSKCLLEGFGYDSSSFKFNDNSDSCVNTYTSAVNDITMQYIQVLPQAGWCGNEVTTDSTKVNYTNTLYIGIQNSSIITSNPLNMSFTCSYNLSMQISLVAALKPTINTVNISVSGEGSVLTTMTAYWDDQFSTPIQENDNVPVGSNVYLGVFSQATDGSSFVIRAESCYATPDNDVNNVNKVSILSGGCPANQGVTAEVLENGVSLESRMKFNSFAFQGQALVYITCEVRLCVKNKTCTGCNVARSESGDGIGILQIPVNFLDDYSTSASNTVVSSWALLVSSMLTYLSVKLF